MELRLSEESPMKPTDEINTMNKKPHEAASNCCSCLSQPATLCFACQETELSLPKAPQLGGKAGGLSPAAPQELSAPRPAVMGPSSRHMGPRTLSAVMSALLGIINRNNGVAGGSTSSASTTWAAQAWLAPWGEQHQERGSPVCFAQVTFRLL